ncbi:efflux RND transporter periplasmic adaptor subunit [Beijerinckia indica]|uniref:Efflux transporter, RND family, MFP subunit n=1 Tax=Beijerinckia indica subsp. indica (strain ATCC 9039 / DSM 1715 / NCIMB 8712) TaxID=395963 RepID=B2IIA5_BEII9|nr:efflux RND transporter periplasmic adaptor subunit [Beijerinckia indica]ACB96059.1 efflux transporter, RND family, MFP subunit [Beijerinckia indica subsp. indica ATCC 9039]
MRLPVILGCFLCLHCAVQAHATEQIIAQSSAPTIVGTTLVSKQPVTKALEFVGRIEAVNKVEVRARVTGYLKAVLFKEGDKVVEGTPLFRIEKEPFDAAVQQAQGALTKTKGILANASLQRARAEELLARQAGTATVRDQRIAEEQTALGDVTMTKAQLESAEINLGYTNITSPIAGVIGRTNVTKGNVVGPNSGILTTIVSLDPTYVVFPVSQREFLRLKDEERRAAGGVLKVGLRFSDGSAYEQSGRVNFVDVTVDKSTDTVTVRASVPNPGGTLIDGQLVRVMVEGDKPQERITVPQTALLADQQGAYVFVVEDGKAVIRRLKLGGEIGSDVIVDNGLTGGEQIIVQGIERVRPGGAVTASPVAPVTDRS